MMEGFLFHCLFAASDVLFNFSCALKTFFSKFNMSSFACEEERMYWVGLKLEGWGALGGGWSWGSKNNIFVG